MGLFSLKEKLSAYSFSIVKFFKSTDFSKAILLGIAGTLPIVLGINLDHFEIGLSICFGALWCAPSNTNGYYRHNKIGILLATLLIVIVSFIGGYFDFKSWYLLPLLGLVTFAIAYISVFGFRASLISFSGLLALVLSFAYETKELELWEHCAWIAVGGLWYLLLVIIWHYINPRAQTEEILSETYALTADYLQTRGKLIDPKNNHKKLRSVLAKKQNDLIEHHEALREILLQSRKDSGQSNYQNKRLLVFIQLIEMLEIAMANPVEYDKMASFFQQNPKYIESFQALIFEIAEQLRVISSLEKKTGENSPPHSLHSLLKNVQREITILKEKKGESFTHFLMLQNLFEYQEKQYEKLKKIKWLLGDPELSESDYIDKETAKQFLPQQDYSASLLLRNFNFGSPIFKHSLRLAVITIIGYGLGSFLEFQNPYWILLTIIVIMRPSYGLTKKRTKERIVGTLIGALLATGIVFFITHPYVFGALGITSLVMAFSLVQKNYRISAVFITLSVIFIYGILRPDILTVIQYRIFDTVFGAALSFMAILWLWPSWSFSKIEESVIKSLTANRVFLERIISFYEKKGSIPIEYNMARKQAFNETSNLSSAFQGMAQEPSSKQKKFEKTYELVVLSHRFLSSLSSLSGYIQNHSTTEASTNFKNTAGLIVENLHQVISQLQDKNHLTNTSSNDRETTFKTLLPQLDHDDTKNMMTERHYQEAHLIREQLQWLFSLSQNMLKLSKEWEV
ncbi:putative membrane protein (TIGR01666 family) [Flavobacteriaceae bacterium MAR_2009_75]|nr:putative membrane protein (TIGR01666 family) [Flavobacteriaceae bacterium MAR_2009_75]